MRKRSLLALTALFLSALVAGCGSGEKAEKNLKVELVVAISGVDDKSYNQSCWETIHRFMKDKGISPKNANYINSMTSQDYLKNLANAADKKPDLVVVSGTYFKESLAVVADKYKDQRFLFLEESMPEAPNVATIRFASEEGCFLAGLAAGLKAKDAGRDRVGFLGGDDLPIIEKFRAGFCYGVHTIDPEIQVVSEFAKDFANPVLGETLAGKMYDEGAYVIFNVAGDTGNGLIKEAKDRAAGGEDVWVIGVDRDQYQDGIYDEQHSVILTSMTKRIDLAVYDQLSKVYDGTFEGKDVVYDLSNQGVGLPEENPNLSEEWLEIMEDYRTQLIDGKLQIPEELTE